MIEYKADEQFAMDMDSKDPMRNYRELFNFPRAKNGGKAVYLCGNSLGLQPKAAYREVENVMREWSELAVNAHSHASVPWMQFHKMLNDQMAKIVGADPFEVAVGNTLTVNLHLLLISFYRPTRTRFKVLMENKAFPSDRYAVASQIKWHEKDPDNGIVEVKTQKGKELVDDETIVREIEKNRNELALILIGAVNYYTGQRYDISLIAKTAQKYGIPFGLDLAHGAGNIPLELHKDNIDFACWCTYKYLNGGPGSLSGFYVHSKYGSDYSLPRLEGWWGNRMDSRFEMRKVIDREPGAQSWIISNPPILGMAPLRASLNLFERAGMDKLRAKSILLTGYLEFLLKKLDSTRIQVITPDNIEKRGCQLSVKIKNADKSFYLALSEMDVICDWREPGVIRFAPTPMYNNFMDLFRLYSILNKIV